MDNRVYNVKVKIRDKKPCDEDMLRALSHDNVIVKAKVRTLWPPISTTA